MRPVSSAANCQCAADRLLQSQLGSHKRSVPSTRFTTNWSSAVDDVHAQVSISYTGQLRVAPRRYRSWGSHIAHVALEYAKQNGAKNFWEVGQATVRLVRRQETNSEAQETAPAP